METSRLSTLYARERSGLEIAMNEFASNKPIKEAISPGKVKYYVDDLEVVVTHLTKEIEYYNQNINALQQMEQTDLHSSILYQTKQKRKQLVLRKKPWQEYKIQINGKEERVKSLAFWMQKQGVRQKYKTVQ